MGETECSNKPVSFTDLTAINYIEMGNRTHPNLDQLSVMAWIKNEKIIFQTDTDSKTDNCIIDILTNSNDTRNPRDCVVKK